MNTHELEIQISSANCDDTPVDQYAQSLAQAGAKNKWCWCSEGPGGLSGFRLDDTENGFITTLVCEAETEHYSQYCLEAKNHEGATEMRSVEWVASGNPCLLRTLYTALVGAMQAAADRVAKDKEVDPEDDITMTNAFVDALIRDVQGNRHRVHFVRKGDGFIEYSFGISESVITLTKEWEDAERAHFFIKMKKPDGTLVLSMGETSSNSDDEAELRRLFHLLDEQLPVVTVDAASEDVRRYVESSTMDTFFDRLLECAQPELPAIDPIDAEGKVLIYDLFTSVCETTVIRQFLDEVAIRKGPLSDPRYKQLKSLAQSVFTIIRNVRREPNGRVFTTRAIAVAYEPGLASRGVMWTSSLSHIANSYVTWGHELVTRSPASGEGRTNNKLAVLILAAVLSDQLRDQHQ